MCPHEEKLTAWLLGDLAPEEHQALTRHLETCGSCRSVSEELAGVLTPLRSGLAKDRNLRVAQRPPQAPQRRACGDLWSTPHEGLKRAALLALSFGSLFALLSIVYQKAQRTPHDASAVTHLTFYRTDEAPAPALTPVAEPPGAAADKDSLAEAVPRSETFTTPPAPVAVPATPAPEPHAPAFRRLVKADAERKAKAAPAEAEETAAPAAAPEKSVAKRERSKNASAPSQRPPADLMTKPVRLAGALAPTNAVPTNAIPTNAAAPAVKHTP